MNMQDVKKWGPALWCLLMLVVGLLIVLTGCTGRIDIATYAQDRARTKDRVLIDRAHGSYEGDRALTLNQKRARYRTAVASTQQSND